MDEWVLREACRQVKAWETPVFPPSRFGQRLQLAVPRDAPGHCGRRVAGLRLESRARTRTDRVHRDAGCRNLRHHAGRVADHGRAPVDRVTSGPGIRPELSPAVSAEPVENRSIVRARPADERKQRKDHARHYRDGAQLKSLGAGRRRETEGQLARLREEGCDEVQGISVQPPGLRGRFRKTAQGDVDARTAA